MLVIVDYLNFVRIACSKNETNSVLIVYANTPLTAAVPFELLKLVAGWHLQKGHLSSSVNQQQLSPSASRDLRRHDTIPITLKQVATPFTSPSPDRHSACYRVN